MLGPGVGCHGVPSPPPVTSGAVMITGVGCEGCFPCLSVDGKTASLKVQDWMIPHVVVHQPVAYFGAAFNSASPTIIDCSSDSSVVVPHLLGLGAMGEAFAGIGGWKIGLSAIKCEVCMAVEWDLETAQAYGRTHQVDVHIIEEIWPLVKSNQFSSKKFIVVADMRDPRVWFWQLC